MIGLIIFVSSFIAGLVQTVAGFGAAIINMLVFPYLLSITAASGINGVMNLVLNIALVVYFFKDINFKKIIFPAIIAMIFSSIAISLSQYLPVATLKLIFSIFIIILAIYFNFFNKVEVKDTPLTMAICSGISGITNGLFSIAGPTMVVYYLASTKKKEEYLGTIQAFFLVTSLYASIMRIFSGIITKDLWPLILVGCVAIYLGKIVGTKIVDKISVELMKKMIYIFLAIVGVIQLVQCI